MAGGRYLIEKKEDSFSFKLYSIGGKLLAKSGSYKTPELCKKGIASLRVNSDAPLCDLTLPEHEMGEPQRCPKIELYKDDIDSYGSYNFRIRAKNGIVIACGEGYGTKTRCLDVIGALRTSARGAVTEEW